MSIILRSKLQDADTSNVNKDWNLKDKDKDKNLTYDDLQGLTANVIQLTAPAVDPPACQL